MDLGSFLENPTGCFFSRCCPYSLTSCWRIFYGLTELCKSTLQSQHVRLLKTHYRGLLIQQVRLHSCGKARWLVTTAIAMLFSLAFLPGVSMSKMCSLNSTYKLFDNHSKQTCTGRNREIYKQNACNFKCKTEFANDARKKVKKNLIKCNMIQQNPRITNNFIIISYIILL